MNGAVIRSSPPVRFRGTTRRCTESWRGSLQEDRILAVSEMVEKPDPAAAPSNFAIIGRYILTPDIFGILETRLRAPREKSRSRTR